MNSKSSLEEDKRTDDVESNICGLGVPGLTGPRGRPGKPGTNGTPGTPGINAWKVKLNGNDSNDLLIPPSILGRWNVKVCKTMDTRSTFSCFLELLGVNEEKIIYLLYIGHFLC